MKASFRTTLASSPARPSLSVVNRGAPPAGVSRNRALREQPVGDELNVAARRDVLESLQVAALLHPARFPAAHARPDRELVVALDEASQDQAPGLLCVAGKPDALEGDGRQDDVAVRGDPALGVPEGVPTGIVLHAVGDVAVRLHAVGVDVEPVHVPVVVEGVDVQDHAVVAA